MLTIRTLLSGGELFGVGARQAGYAHIDGFELDSKIAAVARLNGFNVHVADICQVDYESLPEADHLHASPVCTRASSANVGAEESAADLAMADAICRAIRAHKGHTVTIENVWPYREFKSFKKILMQLSISGFIYDFRHLNSADYGVPQTRKRLILRAVRGLSRVPGLRPTHGKRGGILLERWNGWYRAIEDLIPTLPDTQPAPWQLARMPKELRESMLISSVDSTMRRLDEPATTVMCVDDGHSIAPQAFLMGNNDQEWGDGVVCDDEPCFSVTTQSHGRSRAYIVGGGNTNLEQENKSHARADTEPMFTISAGDGAKKSAAAWLIDGDNASVHHGEPTLRAGDEPAMTMRGTRTSAHRAYTGGRWVRMDIRALGRFQTVPDDYIGLTPAINGNGVPCLLSRRIMESLRGVHAHHD